MVYSPSYSTTSGDHRNSVQAVKAHAKGASAKKVLIYLSRKFGLTVRAEPPRHVQRHRRAGRLEHREQRWYLPRLA